MTRRARRSAKERERELFEEIGRLKMELEWLKKKLASSSVEERRRMIEPRHRAIPITRQCELLGRKRPAGDLIVSEAGVG